ncbi:hypothetical protein [Yinghuangia sp. YIM S09857]|uniref:hypothetical protein n=1 Tax=Yinghuangia sp. YIM S09857 TaxID=3436929 RepID=UPI003F538366
MTTLDAHWAYWSKESGDEQDYRVLACSTGEPGQFTAAVQAENPGTPRTEESGRPESLPWVVFGGHDESEGAFCNLAVMDWTERADWTNRRITATTWVTVPYSELSSRGAEYGDLYAAVLSASMQDGRPLTLNLPDEPARYSGRAGSGVQGGAGAPGSSAPLLYWAAGVAALLLEGRVVVTGASGTDTVDRIAAIDAVCRMLPYGYRAGFSASTWAPVPEQAWQRLCFGEYSGEGLVRVAWGSRVPRPTGPVARRYLDLLTGHLDAGEADRVLLWLRRNARSRPFSEPNRALEVLEALTLAEMVLAEVRSGQGDPDRVIKALSQKGVESFDEESRRSLFTFLFERRDPALYPVMAQYPCAELTEAAAVALHRAMAPAAAGPGGSASDAEVAGIVETFVVPAWEWEQSRADAFAARLLAVPHEYGVPHELVDAWVARFGAAPKREWPQVMTALLGTPQVGLAAVCRCAEKRPKSLGRLIGLLSETGSAPWLTVLRWAIDLPNPGTGAAGTLAQALRQCPSVAVQTFRFAVAYARFETLPLALWQEWLRVAADDRLPEHAELGGWVGDYDPLGDEDATTRVSALMGLLLCLYGRQFAPPIADTAREYVAELTDAGKLLPRGLGTRLDDLPVRMLRGILRAQQDQPDSGPLTVAILLGALDRVDDLGPKACGFLAAEALDSAGRLRPGVQEALAAEGGGESWRRLVAGIPQLALALRLGQLEQDARGGRPTEELAGHWAWLQAQSPAEAEPDPNVRHALESWSGLRKQGAAYDLVLEVRATLLREYGWTARQGDVWLARTVRAILAQDWLGRNAADKLRHTLRERREAARAEEQLLTAMLGDASTRPPARQAPAPTAAPAAPAQPAAPPPEGPPPARRRAEAQGEERRRGEAVTAVLQEARGRGGHHSTEWSDTPWYRSRRALLSATVVLVLTAVLVVLFATGAFGAAGTPSGAVDPSGGTGNGSSAGTSAVSPALNQAVTPGAPVSPASVGGPAVPLNPEPLQASLASPIALFAALVALCLLLYRRPRWSGQLTMRVRRDDGPGYQVAAVLTPDRLGRAFAEGDTENPGLLQLPGASARIRVSARRSWRHMRQVDLLVRVRFADTGRRDAVRCPVGGRRMILGLDMRHDPAPAPQSAEAAPPHPAAAPPPPPTPAPYPYPPRQEQPTTRIAAFPNSSPPPANQPPTLHYPPGYVPPDPYASGEFSGGPETGGPGRWPND